MKNSELKNKVLREIKLSKLQAEATADKNLEKAMENEDFKILYLKIKSLNFDIAKKEFLNQPTSKDKEELKLAKKEMEKVLAKNNIIAKDLTPNYSCSKCKDTALNGEDFCECFYKKLNKAIFDI